MELLFSPFHVYPYVWLVLIAAAAMWVLVVAVHPPPRRRLAALAWPLVTLALVTGPLWMGALSQEVRCRQAGFHLASPVQDDGASLHWESFVPNPSYYSLGVLNASTPLGQSVLRELVRAVSEGRLRSFDLPYEPRRKDVAEADRLFQRFYLAPADGSLGQCVRHEILHHDMKFAPGTCLAVVESQGVQATYELKDAMHDRVAIFHRASGRLMAEHRFVEPETGDTALARFGLRRLRGHSCTPVMRRRDLAEALVHVVFGSSVSPRVEPDALATYRKASWTPVVAAPGEAVPHGKAGIDYWIAKGAVRVLGPGDLELWKRSAFKAKWAAVPDRSYLVTGDIRLPDGLAGGHSVNWVLPPGRPIPPGPRGHSTFYEVDRGCVWSTSRCQHGY